ncbi:MAG: carboxy-S-adenosyl-L-methionine synthase CmoA [Woeseiaceae bacterium]|nr:carboxy-S-adenosyl-L-methionine synthase CmoA [Woeseiaceae bacterium]
MPKDEIFKDSDADPGSFEFNESVAEVFPDMLRRSIPGYDASLEAIGTLAHRYVSPGTHCYDLGCSLGAATLAMRRNIAGRNCHIVSVDLAPAMVERCRKRIDEGHSDTPVSVETADIRDIEIRNASMVVLNYTLQFLPVEDRIEMIRKIHDGLNRGGVLFLSEKVADDDPTVESLLVELHHAFKRTNDYSDLEIARKRSALDKVLVPETIGIHLNRLEAAGFQHRSISLKYFNFVSILAIR